MNDALSSGLPQPFSVCARSIATGSFLASYWFKENLPKSERVDICFKIEFHKLDRPAIRYCIDLQNRGLASIYRPIEIILIIATIDPTLQGKVNSMDVVEECVFDSI